MGPGPKNYLKTQVGNMVEDSGKDLIICRGLICRGLIYQTHL